VLREAFRVLKPGGRFAVSDVVVQGELPAELRKSMELWAGCIAGALEETTYRQLLTDAGFLNVDVEVTRVYDAQDLAASECCGDSLATQSGFSEPAASGGRLVSAFVRATKSTGAPSGHIAEQANVCCSTAEQSRAASPPTRQRAARPDPRQHPPGAAAAKRRQRRRSMPYQPGAVNRTGEPCVCGNGSPFIS
jgi:Methyltransferase domain